MAEDSSLTQTSPHTGQQRLWVTKSVPFFNSCHVRALQVHELDRCNVPKSNCDTFALSSSLLAGIQLMGHP
jgi:hypothetical protein